MSKRLSVGEKEEKYPGKREQYMQMLADELEHGLLKGQSLQMLDYATQHFGGQSH